MELSVSERVVYLRKEKCDQDPFSLWTISGYVTAPSYRTILFIPLSYITLDTHPSPPTLNLQYLPVSTLASHYHPCHSLFLARSHYKLHNFSLNLTFFPDHQVIKTQNQNYVLYIP